MGSGIQKMAPFLALGGAAAAPFMFPSLGATMGLAAPSAAASATAFGGGPMLGAAGLAGNFAGNVVAPGIANSMLGKALHLGQARVSPLERFAGVARLGNKLSPLFSDQEQYASAPTPPMPMNAQTGQRVDRPTLSAAISRNHMNPSTAPWSYQVGPTMRRRIW